MVDVYLIFKIKRYFGLVVTLVAGLETGGGARADTYSRPPEELPSPKEVKLLEGDTVLLSAKEELGMLPEATGDGSEEPLNFGCLRGVPKLVNLDFRFRGVGVPSSDRSVHMYIEIMK